MTITVEKFEQWCVVEIMGHKKFAGFVTEQSLGGSSFVRIDVPEITLANGTQLPAFTKLFGAGSIYCLSPCTEETAKAFAAQLRSEAFALYEAPRLPAPRPAENSGYSYPETCEECGTPISRGSVCDDCAVDLSGDEGHG